MADSAPAWLCYGDYVCLSTSAGANQSQQKYLLGHSSPLMQLQKLQKPKSEFASIILAENVATVPFTSEPSGKNVVLDLITNAHLYWFEILPQTDYDMSVQLGLFEKRLGDAEKRLVDVGRSLKQFKKPNQNDQAQPAPPQPSTKNVFRRTPNIVHPEPIPHDVSEEGIESSKKEEERPAVSQEDINEKMKYEEVVNLEKVKIEQENVKLLEIKLEIENLKSKIEDCKKKMLQEQIGNAQTITRVHGDALVFGALIQLRHVASKRLITVTKHADHPVELVQDGRSGSLFYIERVSTGVAGGSTKVPAESNIVRLRSYVSDSQFLRMEPNLQLVTGTKFPVSLDVELDGVFNADQCFQLGTGAAAPGDNRVEWIIERCKHNAVAADDSSEADSDSDDAEDDVDGVDVSEVLSGCQIIRLFHRASESYICALPSKVDHGKVFFSHRSESDPSKGSGSIANSYWRVIDGDGNVRRGPKPNLQL